MSNRRFTQFFETLHKRPTLLDCNFIVDSTNSLGIRSLNASGIEAVYMHTSTTPAAGNPNPAAGYAMIVLSDTYNGYFGGFNAFLSPASGSGLTSGLTVGVPYVITSLGSSSLAQWQTAGLPVGITPALGVAFVAAATSVAGGGQVQLSLNSGITSIEVVGNPKFTIASNAKNVPGSSTGSYILVQFLKQSLAMASYTPAGTVAAPVLTMNSYTPAGTNDGSTPPLFTGAAATLTGTNSAPAFTGAAATLTGTVSLAVGAPVNGSVVNMSFYLSNSYLG